MKIAPVEIENFINSRLTEVMAVLIYGPDLGLVQQRAVAISNNYLKSHKSHFNFVEFSFDKIADDFSNVAHALFSKSLTNENKIIHIINMGNSLPKQIATILDRYQGNNLLVLCAGDLAPSSSLRKYFENGKKIASLPCYVDEKLTVRKIILSKLSASGIKIDAQALKVMEDTLFGDRMLILSEIEKLITYIGDEKEVRINDVLSVISGSDQSNLDYLCAIIADRDIKQFSQFMMNNATKNISIITILRAMNRYFTRLYQVKVQIAKGYTILKAINELSPPVFFKNIEIFKKHLNLWTLAKLSEILEMIVMWEIKYKKNYNLPFIIFEYEVMKLVGK